MLIPQGIDVPLNDPSMKYLGGDVGCFVPVALICFLLLMSFLLHSDEDETKPKKK